MPTHQEERLLPYTSRQLFDLVADVEKYPLFLPWCISCNITKKTINFIEADMTVGFKMIKEKFKTRVFLNSDNLTIDIEYLQGPFEYLQNQWRFKDYANNCCQLIFSIHYKFKSAFLQGLSAVFFTESLRKLTKAFENRAHQLYKTNLLKIDHERR